jgi:competence protein ComEC
VRDRLATALDDVLHHPRHVVLAGLVAGLLLTPVAGAALPVLGGLIVVVLVPAARRLGPWARGAPCSAAVLALGAVLAALAGCVGGQARVAASDATALRPLLGQELELDVVVLEPPRTRGWGGKVAPGRIVVGHPGAGERIVLRLAAHGGVRAAWPRSPTGAVVRVRGRLRELGPADVVERRRGAHAQLVVDRLAATGARRGGVAGAIDAARRRAEDALARALPSAEAGLARGMVLGQDDALADDVRDDFRASGLAHLLAASGTNVALLAALVVLVATGLGLGLTGRMLLALAAIAVYVPLAGGGPSIQRAGIMGAAGLVAILAGRPASRWYALLLAALVTLALDPRAAGDVGWQLSFAAVVALLAVGPGLAAWLRRGLPGPVAEALALTVAATLGTAPLVALYFGRVSVVSLGANLLAAPVVAPIMWLGAVAATVGQLAPSLAAIPSAMAGPPLGFLGWLARAAARAPGAEATVALTPAGAVAAYAAMACAWLGLRHRGAALARRIPRFRRRLVIGGVVAAVVLTAGVARSRAPGPPDGLVVSFLDVGQGDATLVQHGEHALLVDAGPPDGPVVRRLRDAGVRRLDALVITHASADHDGGAAAVLRALAVGAVLDGGEATQPTTGRRAAAAEAHARRVPRVASDVGQTVRAGPITAQVLWPPRAQTAGADADPNLRATVLHVSDGEFDLLLSADAESEVLRRLDLPPVEAMKVPHHGSADPGLPDVLQELRPQVAVIPVGRNTYGHPAPGTLAALRAAVPEVRRTDEDGTVRLHVDDGRIRVEASR